MKVGALVKLVAVIVFEGVTAEPTTPLIEDVVVEIVGPTTAIVTVVVADCPPEVPVIV